MNIGHETFSAEAQIVWDMLSSNQHKVLAKNYPIKKERNKVISELHNLKIEVQVIAEVSGLSRQSISTIIWKEVDPDKATIEALKADLKKIQRAVGRLGSHIAKLEEKQGK